MNVILYPDRIEASGSFAKGEKPYAAKLIGLHPIFGFQRQFIGKKTKSGKTEGNFTIVIPHDELKPGDVFEARCGEEKLFYHFISDLIIQGIEKNEALNLIKNGKVTQMNASAPAVNSKALADYTDKEIIQECIRRNLR